MPDVVGVGGYHLFLDRSSSLDEHVPGQVSGGKTKSLPAANSDIQNTTIFYENITTPFIFNYNTNPSKQISEGK